MVIFIFFIFNSIIYKLEANISNNSYNNNLNITKNNLILGSIIDYDWKVLAPFFISFKRVHFNNCDCVMFVENITQETINKMESFNAKIIKIPKRIKSLIINYRHKLYVDFLKNNTDKYNLVLSIDVRDSFFQKDIFKYYEGNKSFLSFAIEDGTLSGNPNNKWIIDAFGKDVYNAIKHERVICGGTVLGTPDKMIELSSIIWKIMNQSDYSREKWIDQAVINYLIYYKKLFENDTIIRNKNRNSSILTLATASSKKFIIDPEGNILNINGDIVAIVHQYDRHKSISKKVLEKYSNDSTEENYDKNVTGNKNYSIISSSSYLNQSQINHNYINLSLTNISTNNISSQKENNDLYLTKNNYKINIKNQLYIFSFYLLSLLVIMLCKFKCKNILNINKN